MNLEKAFYIALKAHSEQVDKGGQPYILHPINVMNSVDGENERVVAILHDVLEDTNVTLDVLDAKGISKVQREALLLLTHKRNTSYADYIQDLAPNDIARVVKIADLRHNMLPDRVILNEDSCRTKKRIAKYEMSLNYLLNYKNRKL